MHTWRSLGLEKKWKAKREVKVKGEREEGKGRTKRRQETEDRTLFTSAILL